MESQAGWYSMRGSARQGKMRDKQGRNDPLVPTTPEVAVHCDGGLRRPAQEAARPATASSAAVTTALEAALSARVAHIFYPPPPPPTFAPLDPLRRPPGSLPPAALTAAPVKTPRYCHPQASIHRAGAAFAFVPAVAAVIRGGMVMSALNATAPTQAQNSPAPAQPAGLSTQDP